jgi:hypothetical protein
MYVETHVARGRLLNNEILIETSSPIFCDFYITRNNPRGIIPINSAKNSRNDFFLVRLSKLYLKLPSSLALLPLSSFATAIKCFDVSSIA